MGTSMEAAAIKPEAGLISSLTSLHYRNSQPVHFTEMGVDFYIFPNGEFDFNTGVIVRSGRRSSVSAIYTSPNVRISYKGPSYYSTVNRGVRIEHDNYGRIRRIGRIFVNYDRSGRVRQIGTVRIDYHRGNGRLAQVGGLKVKYNGNGRLIYSSGIVNHNSRDYWDDENYRDDRYYYADNDYDREDYQYYYYKDGSKLKKHGK